VNEFGVEDGFGMRLDERYERLDKELRLAAACADEYPGARADALEDGLDTGEFARVVFPDLARLSSMVPVVFCPIARIPSTPVPDGAVFLSTHPVSFQRALAIPTLVF